MQLAILKVKHDPVMRLLNDQFDDVFGVGTMESLRGATQDLRDDHDARQRNAQYASDEFIQEADAGQCLHLINNLIERVSYLTGTAKGLEEAASELGKHIASNAGPQLCAACNGSGEGQYDRTTCRQCKGTGTEATA